MELDTIRQKLRILFPAIGDKLIEIALEQSLSFAKTYCNREELPEDLAGTICRMAQETITNLGAEGLKSESAGGSSIQYMEDYSPRVYKQLKKHKRIKVG